MTQNLQIPKFCLSALAYRMDVVEAQVLTLPAMLAHVAIPFEDLLEEVRKATVFSSKRFQSMINRFLPISKKSFHLIFFRILSIGITTVSTIALRISRSISTLPFKFGLNVMHWFSV